MIRKRLVSLLSALALVISLFTLLPEGALKAEAAEQCELKIQVSYNKTYGNISRVIKFDGEEPTSNLDKKTVKKGDTVRVVAECDDFYYYFTGWYEYTWDYDRGAWLTKEYSDTLTIDYTVKDDTTLYAQYRPKIEVMFIDEQPAENIGQPYSRVIKSPEYLFPGYKATDPYGNQTYGNENTPYVRTGWRNMDGTLFDFSQQITENKIVKMGYKEGAHKYHLYDKCEPDEGGVIGRGTGSVNYYYEFGETEFLTASANPGYRFAYWLDNSPAQKQYINSSIHYAVKGNYTLTAVFKKENENPNVYDIVVQHGVATATNGATRKYEATAGTTLKIQADQGIRSNMVFDHWTVVRGNITLADPYSASTTFTMPSGHVAIRADYKEINTIYFDPNGGSGYMEEQYVDAGKKYTLPSCGFTAPEGMVFAGWSAGQPGDEIDVTEIMYIKALWNTVVTDVDVYINKPVAGETIGSRSKSYGYSPNVLVRTRDGIRYRDLFYWHDGTKYLGDSAVFEGGKYYYAYVKFKAASGYELSENMNVTVEGVKAEKKSLTVDENGVKWALYSAKFYCYGDNPSRLVGDLNGDGNITADDAIIVARLAAGYGDYAERYDSDVADMNQDGKVTADDAIIIARYAAGYGNYREIYTKYI